MNTAEPIRDKEKIKAMTEYFLQKGQLRNYALFIMGIHTALRISDLLRLRWGDVYDAKRGRMKEVIAFRESKTGKSKIIALNKAILQALKMLFMSAGHPDGSRFLFENKRTGLAISRIQAYRVIKAAADDAATMGIISCHSLRKTFGYHAWKTGVQLAVIMEIYNHSSFHVTRRYLGITQDDMNSAYLGLHLV